MNALSRLGRLSLPRTPTARRGLAYEVGGTVSEAGAEARSWGTLRHQNELPKMPVPPLEATMARYLDRTLPLLASVEAQAATKAKVAAFLAGDGPALHQRLLDLHASEENYVDDLYRELYSGATGSSYSLNPNFVLHQQPGDTSAAKVGARLVRSALGHYVACQSGMYPPTKTKGGALDMRQLPWIHASARVATAGQPDALVCHVDKPAQHFVVLCQGAPYRVPLASADGGGGAYRVLSAAAIEAELDAVVAHAAAAAAAGTLPPPVGALTTGARPAWEGARAKLAASAEGRATLADVDEALLVLAIDDSPAAVGLSGAGMERNVLYGVDCVSVANRWMDKWVIIVTADGQAGMNWEHSLLDGHTMMEFFAPVAAGADEVAFGCPEPAEELTPSAEAPAVAARPLFWGSGLDASTVAAIETQVSTSLALAEACGVETLEFSTYGGATIKSLQCSPDGFAQAALFLAFYTLRGRVPVPYESVLAKAFKHGRVTVSRNTSEALSAELTGFNALAGDHPAQAQSFRAMVSEIGRICREAAAGQEMDRPILAYRSLAKQAPALSMPFLEDAGWAALQNIDLCTSHCGKPPIRFFGYEPAAADGYSVGYYVANDHMQFSINHFDKAAAAEYKAALEATLAALPAIFKA